METPEWFTRAVSTPGESRFVDVEDCAIHYLRWGDPRRPGLVFVPPSGGHAHWFDHVAPAFAEQFHVVAMDPSGCGDSGRRETYGQALITAETDAAVLRRAVAQGAVNLVLTPFGPGVLTQRLAAFARFWHSLESGQADQRGVDRALAVLREGDSPAGAMPKGRSAVTADAIRDALQGSDDALTAQDVADATGVSRATAQRYLADLVAAGRVELGLRYGSTGRPEHRYTWRG